MEYYKNLDLKDIVYFCDNDLVWKKEKWKPIPNYEDSYQLSNLGRVKSLSRDVWNGFSVFFKKELILKQIFDNNGYLQVGLWKNNKNNLKRVHLLICVAFLNHITDRKHKIVDHKNNIKTDNRLINLQIVTNRFNSTKDKNSKSGHSCIYLNNNSWLVRMRVNGIKKSIGTFKNIEDAIKERDLFLNSLNKQTNK